MILENHVAAIAFVPIPKVASQSLSTAISGSQVEATTYPAIAFVRHPWDRITSALYSALMACDTPRSRLQRALAEDDPHVRPQIMFINGYSPTLYRYEDLGRVWPELQRRHGFGELKCRRRGLARPKRWEDVPLDWNRYRHIYTDDFALWRSLAP